MGAEPDYNYDFRNQLNWTTTSMRGVHGNERREEEQPPIGLQIICKATLNRRYIGPVHKFYICMYEGGQGV